MMSILTPAYWGSLGGLLFGLSFLVLGPLSTGAPAYLNQIDDEHRWPVFVATTIIVIVLILRNYSAVSVSTHVGSEASIFRMPPPLRKLIFALLTLVIVACSLAAGAISLVGISMAMRICALMAVMSFLCWLIVWTLSIIKPKIYSTAGAVFGLGDILICGLCLWLSWVTAHGVDSTGETGAGICALTIMLLFANECNIIYRQPFLRQFHSLFKALNRPPLGSKSKSARSI